QIKFKIIRFKKPPIIILTPGKVGSTSVYYSIKKGTEHPVFHIHNLSQEGIENSNKLHFSSDRKSIPLHLIISKLLKIKLKKYQGKVFIITIVREPISREISSFLQNTEMYKSVLENKKLEIDINKAHELLSSKLELGICKSIEEWFELEIKGNFGIDVFKIEFDKEKKYIITSNNNCHMLLLRMEELDELFPKTIQEFLKLQNPLYLKKSNLGEKKHYAMAYNGIRKNIKLSPATIKGIVNSKYFQHFYKAKTTEITNRWIKKI
ncbi:MAG TPA: putative capsular polysaccharide synthesis family protein, partial [Flavobacteriaceae bacterium]|nr:putative capsular polysaccharide synthesis family protein [Flavobacteriaceae bacterium]